MRDSVIALVALVQGAFFALLVLLLFVNRARRMRKARRAAAASVRVAEPFQRWVMGRARATEVAAVLLRLEPQEALDQLTMHVATRVAPERISELGRALREDRWVRRILNDGFSRFWWNRLDAARLLAVVGGMRDRGLLLKLLEDEHPAVQAAASASLTRIGDYALDEHVLDTLHKRSPIVRVFQVRVLRETWRHTVPALVKRLTPMAPVAKLAAWIDLAESLGDAQCLASLLAFKHHPVPHVRIATARALRRYMHPDCAAILREMILDDDWRVRAQAARALGSVGASEAVPELTSALGDQSWWVRFRAALALAQLGDAGRSVLRAARELPDRYAGDMAAMVIGLSDGALVELAEA
jgi:HEAT repeat protein